MAFTVEIIEQRRADVKRLAESRQLLANLADLSDENITRLLGITVSMKKSEYHAKKALEYSKNYSDRTGEPLVKQKRPRVVTIIDDNNGERVVVKKETKTTIDNIAEKIKMAFAEAGL